MRTVELTVSCQEPATDMSGIKVAPGQVDFQFDIDGVTLRMLPGNVKDLIEWLSSATPGCNDFRVMNLIGIYDENAAE